jgi:photosystem II stability/assembly factor-like uncharacterized protein
VVALAVTVCLAGAVLSVAVYGSEWANLSAGTEEKGLRAVAVDPMDSRRVFIGSTKGVFTSGDGGKVWVNCLDLSGARREIPPGLDPSRKALLEGLQASGDSGRIGGATALAIDPANQRKIFAGSVDGIYTSTDGGKTWAKANGAMKDAEVTVLGLAIDLSNPDLVYAATLDRALLKSGDGGRTWSPTELPGGGGIVSAVAVHPFDSNILYAGTPDAVYKTRNGGANWEKIAAQPRIAESIAIDPVNPDVVYLGTSAGAFKSTDGGASWKEIGADALGQKRVRRVAVSPSDSNAVYAASSTGIYGSSDGGAKWQELSKGTSLANAMAIAFDPLDSGTIWAAASGGLYRTAVAFAAPAATEPAKTEAPVPVAAMAEKPAEEVVPAQTVPAQTAPDEEQVAVVSLEEPRSLGGAPGMEGAASPGPAIPTIDDVQTVLGQFTHEPSVQEVQEVAMRFAEVHPDLIEGWRKGAKYRALLPKFRLKYDVDRRKKIGEKDGRAEKITRNQNLSDQIESFFESSPNTGITLSDKLKSITSIDNGYELKNDWDNADERQFTNSLSFQFEWELGDFLYNPDQVRISDEARDLVELRNDVLEEVTQFYFQRRNLQIDLLLSPAEELRERLRLELQLQEVTANIDYLTGGYLTQRLNDAKANKPGTAGVVKRLFAI